MEYTILNKSPDRHRSFLEMPFLFPEATTNRQLERSCWRGGRHAELTQGLHGELPRMAYLEKAKELGNPAANEYIKQLRRRNGD